MHRDKSRASRAKRTFEQAQAQQREAERQVVAREAIRLAQQKAQLQEQEVATYGSELERHTKAALTRLEAKGFPGMAEVRIPKTSLIIKLLEFTTLDNGPYDTIEHGWTVYSKSGPPVNISNDGEPWGTPQEYIYLLADGTFCTNNWHISNDYYSAMRPIRGRFSIGELVTTLGVPLERVLERVNELGR